MPATDHGTSGPVPGPRRRVVRDSLSLGVPVGLYGLAFGATAATAGFSVPQACVLSLVLFSGGSQFALVGVLGAGGGLGAGVGAALLLGVRNTMYGLRLAPMLQVRGAKRLLAAHGVIDETTAMATGQVDDKDGRLAFWLVFAAIFTVWNGTTLVGAVVATGLPDAARAALDGIVPAAFLALLWPRLRSGAPQRWTALIGAAIAVLGVLVLPPGLGVVAASISAVVVWLVQERRS